MFLLTPTERKVLLFIGILILGGSLLRFSGRSNVRFGSRITEKNSVSSAQKCRLEVVNINKADKQELAKLPGIGEKTAALIIEYRAKQGEFKSLDDLKNIKGIKDKKIERIKKYVIY